MVPASGDCLMTVPGGSGLVFSLTSTTKPASSSVVWATPASIVTTSGTSTSVPLGEGLGEGGPLETTMSTAVPLSTFTPSPGSWRITWSAS